MHLPLLQHRSAPARQSAPRSVEAVRVLRISLTDRCNLRCVYCMPAAGLPWLDRLLTDEEICDVVRAAVEVHGIRRFKLTGGEPTVRPGLTSLVRQIRRIPGILDLSLTTNGILLQKLAGPLRDAGLDRVTVSLDSLRPDRFRQITRNGDIADVMSGLRALEEAGFAHTKINCVIMRDLNADEVVDFARLTIARDLSVRFIEYMPIGALEECGVKNQDTARLVSEAEMRQTIETEVGPLQRLSPSSQPGIGPATMYRLARSDAVGRLGFISAMSHPFCGSCNRLRLTAEGQLRSCLFDGGEVDLKPVLRNGKMSFDARRQELGRAMQRCVGMKPEVHGACGNDPMSRVGG